MKITEANSESISIGRGGKAFNFSVNISEKFNYMYVETPKVACTALKVLLHRLELNDVDRTIVRPGFIHQPGNSPLKSPSEIEDFDGRMHEFFSFCFVRNPYTRLLSAYLEKIVRNKKPKEKILKAMSIDPGNIETEVSFEDFVRVVVEQNVEQMDKHWRSQVDQTYQSSIDYDFVGKLESLTEDLATVMNVLQIEEYKIFLHERGGVHETNATDIVAEYYTREIKTLVYKKFEADFDTFDYPI